MRKTILIIWGVTSVFLLGMVSTAFAGRIIIVDDDGPAHFNNIQAAINDCNDGDTVIVADDIYAGAGNRDIEFKGKAITVKSENGPENCIIDCENSGRGFYFHSGEGPNSVLDGFTITNGYASEGGGIYCRSSGPTITNCVISDNTASEYGGGIYCYASCPAVTGCAIIGNKAREGGGMYNYYSSPKISSCIISCNAANVNGGGMYDYRSGPILSNCTLSSNAAGAYGGGIFSPYYSSSRLFNCILWGNMDISGKGETAQITWDITPLVMFCCIQDNDPNDANIPFAGDGISNIDDNPMFVREPNDGGDGWGVGDNDDFGDLHLQDGSPCINTGNTFIGIDLGSVDIDGQPRVMGGTADIGADEFFIRMIAVTRPEGGEVWATASTHEILWSSHLYEEAVDILLSDDGGSNWDVVESNVPDTGSYMWRLPRKGHSDRCLVSVVPSVPDPNVLCVESGVFTIQHYPRRPPAPRGRIARWDKFRRTGLSEYDGPELGCVKWQFETNRAVSASVAVDEDERVHIPCEDGNLYTLDANGVLLWSYDANSPLLSSPSLGYYGMIYVGSKDGKLHAIDGGGKLRWTYKTNGPIYSSPAISGDGNIYVCSQHGVLYALGHDGSELWTFETDGFDVAGGSIFASPAIGADGTVYIGGLYDPNLYALNPEDGSVKWACNFESGGWPFTSPVVAADGTIYQTLLYDPSLYALDPNDGNIIWATEMVDKESGWSKPVLGPDGTIYVSFDDPYLQAVAPNGSIKWVTPLSMIGGYTLTVSSDGLIYAAGDNGNLCVITGDGENIAQFENPGWLSFPVIAADNTVIVSDSRDNTMYITDVNNTVWAITQQGCQGQVPALRLFEDLDADGAVNFKDFALLAAGWLDSSDASYTRCSRGRCGAYLTGDVNKDLYVNIGDLAALADVWLSGYLSE